MDYARHFWSPFPAVLEEVGSLSSSGTFPRVVLSGANELWGRAARGGPSGRKMFMRRLMMSGLAASSLPWPPSLWAVLLTNTGTWTDFSYLCELSSRDGGGLVDVVSGCGRGASPAGGDAYSCEGGISPAWTIPDLAESCECFVEASRTRSSGAMSPLFVLFHLVIFSWGGEVLPREAAVYGDAGFVGGRYAGDAGGGPIRAAAAGMCPLDGRAARSRSGSSCLACLIASVVA
jgi:hypothetical protein